MSLPTTWHGDWSAHKAVVLGLGKSGFSALDTLSELGVEAAAVGQSADERLIDLAEVIGSRFISDDSPAVAVVESINTSEGPIDIGEGCVMKCKGCYLVLSPDDISSTASTGVTTKLWSIIAVSMVASLAIVGLL